MSEPSTTPAAAPTAEPSTAPAPAPAPTIAPAPAPGAESPAPGPSPATPSELSDPTSQLTTPQQLALHHLAAGASIRDAASGAGVGRRTLHRWMRDDPDFAAAYNAWRQELIDSARARALAMTDQALVTIRRAIVGGDAYAALQLVRGMGVLREPKVGSQDPSVVRRRGIVVAARRESRLYKAERSYEVTSSKPLETPQEIDEVIASLQRMKEHLIHTREVAWRFYENTKDLTEDECYRRGCRKLPMPADYPGEGWEQAARREPPPPQSDADDIDE